MNKLRYGVLEFQGITKKEQLGKYFKPVIACITSAFANKMPTNEINDAIKGDIFIALTNQGKVIGFASSHKTTAAEYKRKPPLPVSKKTRMLSLSAATVLKKYHGNGIYKKLNVYRLGHLVNEKITVLTTTTQNPRIEAGIISTLKMYKKGSKLKQFRMVRVLISGLYKRRLTHYPLKPKYRDLDYSAGDAYSLIFYLDY